MKSIFLSLLMFFLTGQAQAQVDFTGDYVAIDKNEVVFKISPFNSEKDVDKQQLLKEFDDDNLTRVKYRMSVLQPSSWVMHNNYNGEFRKSILAQLDLKKIESTDFTQTNYLAENCFENVVFVCPAKGFLKFRKEIGLIKEKLYSITGEVNDDDFIGFDFYSNLYIRYKRLPLSYRHD